MSREEIEQECKEMSDKLQAAGYDFTPLNVERIWGAYSDIIMCAGWLLGLPEMEVDFFIGVVYYDIINHRDPEGNRYYNVPFDKKYDMYDRTYS